MTLDNWRNDEASRKALADALSVPIIQQALLTLKLHFRAGDTIEAPPGLTAHDSILWHHAALVGVSRAFGKLENLPLMGPRNPQPITPVADTDIKEVFWAEPPPKL